LLREFNVNIKPFSPFIRKKKNNESQIIQDSQVNPDTAADAGNINDMEDQSGFFSDCVENNNQNENSEMSFHSDFSAESLIKTKISEKIKIKCKCPCEYYYYYKLKKLLNKDEESMKKVFTFYYNLKFNLNEQIIQKKKEDIKYEIEKEERKVRRNIFKNKKLTELNENNEAEINQMLQKINKQRYEDASNLNVKVSLVSRPVLKFKEDNKKVILVNKVMMEDTVKLYYGVQQQHLFYLLRKSRGYKNKKNVDLKMMLDELERKDGIIDFY